MLNRERRKEKLNKKLVFAIFVLVMLSLVVFPDVPVKSWYYTNTDTEDTKYEKFGPRADKLLIKLYGSASSEFDALEVGEIDITDWPLTQSYYDKFTTLPQNASIATTFYGIEHGIFLLDINWNNNLYLGNPPNVTYPNPVYPNPCSVLSFRQAIWHLVDRETWFPIVIGAGFYSPLLTVVPPSMGPYSLPIPNPYPYNRTAAEALLDADGFPLNPDTGWRFWDRAPPEGEPDGVEQPDEYLELKFLIRSDDPHRLAIGSLLADELNAVNVRVDRIYGTQAVALLNWHLDKAVHLYTGAWSLGRNPDHLTIWNSCSYWHPGFCYNTGYVNDEILDQTSDGVWAAATQFDAITNATAFQQRFADVAAAVPLWSYSGTKAVRRCYTGGTNEVLQGDGEDPYRGNYWDGIVNILGYGVDNYWSFLNMHPQGYERGTGDMTIRYGMSAPTVASLNPIYATKEHDWQVLGLIYDTLLKRNPYNSTELIPWLVQNYTVGLWYDFKSGTNKTRVRFKMRPCMYWSDGTPLTASDVEFTLLEITAILADRGLPPPWWTNIAESIVDFKTYNPYNFDVLFDFKSIFPQDWMGDQTELGRYKWPSSLFILPRHIWQPIVTTEAPCEGPCDPRAPWRCGPTGFAPDINMIGSGPWRLQKYNLSLSPPIIQMVAHKPGSTVTTWFDDGAGNTETGSPITSPHGYFRYYPVLLESINPGFGSGYIFTTGPRAFNITLSNHYLGGAISFVANIKIDSDPPYDWHTFHPPPKIPAGGTWVHTTPILNFPHFAKANVTVSWNFTDPTTGTWVTQNCTLDPWVTIKEDIVGSTLYDDMGLSTYPYKSTLPSPDFKVNIRDVATAAIAFGSYPGNPKWSKVADINDDYKINIRDVAAIAFQFGWTG